MDLFLGIGDMPIYNFDKALKSSNMAYLVVGWNERKEITPPKEAVERWNEIYNIYCEKTVNNDALTFYSLSAEIGYLEMRYSAIFTLINNMCEAYKEPLGRALNKWGVPFNIKGKIKPQIKQLESNLKFSAHIIERKKSKLEGLKGDEDEQISLIQQKIKLERTTEIKINLKETSVEEWIELHNEAKSIIAQQKKSRNG